jgi:hypothetical protein
VNSENAIHSQREPVLRPKGHVGQNKERRNDGDDHNGWDVFTFLSNTSVVFSVMRSLFILAAMLLAVDTDAFSGTGVTTAQTPLR